MSIPTPLRLTSVRIWSFRNLELIDWKPHTRFNVLWGNNAQGKSNVLEALYAVGSLRSFRGARPAELVRWDGFEGSVDARLEDGEDLRHLAIRMSSETGRLTVRVDDKRPENASAYFGVVQMVLFHPGDVDVIRGSPDGRRRWLDRLLYQLFPGYADDHRQYTRALRSRNRLLADGAGDAAVTAWEGTMAPLAARIVSARAAAIAPLTVAAERAHASLSGVQDVLRVEYKTSVRGDEEVFQLRWAADRDRDRAAERTRAGPHRDDVDLLLGDRLARSAASQGQQRSIALALKLAEISVLEGLRHRTPILLLDDVSSELDPTRNEALFRALGERGGQVFVTTTRREYVKVAKDRKDFEISGGRLASE